MAIMPTPKRDRFSPRCCARLLIICMFVLCSGNALALNVQLLRPTSGVVQGYQVFTSETMPQFDLSVGMAFNEVHHPLEIGIVGTDQRATGLVDDFVTGDFLLSFAGTDWLMFNLDVPFNFYHNIAPVFIPTRDKGGPDMGDIMFSAKFRALDTSSTSSHLGLAAIPFITIPTGAESIYFGDKSFTGGLILAGDGQFKSNRLYLNIGARFRKTERILNLVIKHEFLYGLGFQRPLWKAQHLDIIAEIYGSTTFSKFFTEEISTPVQGHILFQKKFLDDLRLVANIGGGLGLTNGYGAPDFRVMATIGYQFSLHSKEAKPRLSE